MTNLITNPIIPLYVVIPVMAVLVLFTAGLLIVRRAAVKKSLLWMGRLLLCLGLVFMINLRVQTATLPASVSTKNLDVLFVLDNTLSMWATDGRTSTRMDDAVSDCQYIMEKLEGANFALIQFDNYSQILAPFTQNAENVLDALDTMKQPDQKYALGTTLSLPVADMEMLLLSSSRKDNRKAIVFYLSDGETNHEEKDVTFKDLAKYIDGGAVLGYGTEKGAKMEVSFGSVQDPVTNKAAISKIDEQSLRILASQMGVSYIHMEDKTNVDYRVDSALRMARKIITESEALLYEDSYFKWSYPLMALLCGGLLYAGLRQVGGQRRKKHGEN